MAQQFTMPLVDTKIGGSPNTPGSVPFPVAVGDRRSNFSTAVKKTLGHNATLAPATSVNLDLRKGPVHSTTGIPYAIGGTATVVSQKVGLWLASFDDPIKAILGVGVHKDEKIIIKRKYCVGGGATIVPERAPARTVAIQEDVREVTLTRYGGDIEMNLNLFLTGEAEEEMDMKIDCQKRELERQLIKIGYDTLMTEGTLLTDAIMRSSPAYAQPTKLASQAFQIYSTKIFGAINKFRFPIANLLAAAKYASAYSLCSQKGSVMIIPHGVPELTTIARKEKMQYNISGLQNNSKITMDMDGAFTDPNSGVRILVHHSTPSYENGAANPTVNLANANLTDTCHVISIHKAKHGATNKLSTTKLDTTSADGIKTLKEQLCLMAKHHFTADDDTAWAFVCDTFNTFRPDNALQNAQFSQVYAAIEGLTATSGLAPGGDVARYPAFYQKACNHMIVSNIKTIRTAATIGIFADARFRDVMQIILFGFAKLRVSLYDTNKQTSLEALLVGVSVLSYFMKENYAGDDDTDAEDFVKLSAGKANALFASTDVAKFMLTLAGMLRDTNLTKTMLNAWGTQSLALCDSDAATFINGSIDEEAAKTEMKIVVKLAAELVSLLIDDIAPDGAAANFKSNIEDKLVNKTLEQYAKTSLHVDEINVQPFNIDDCTQGPGLPLTRGNSAAASDSIRKYFASLYGDRHTISIADIEHGGIRHEPGAVTVRIAKVIASSAILAAPGDSTGQLLIGYPFTGVSTSATEERMRVQLRCYLGAALYQPDAVMILPNVFVDGIDSCKYYTFSSIGWATQLEEAIYHMQMSSGGFETPSKVAALKTMCLRDKSTVGDKGKFAEALLDVVKLWEDNHLNVYPVTSGRNRVRLPAGSLYDKDGNKICDNEGEFGDLDDKKNYIGLHGVPQAYERGNF